MKKTNLIGCMGILAMAATLGSCSSNDDTTPNPGTNGAYTWTTNGGLKNGFSGKVQYGLALRDSRLPTARRAAPCRLPRQVSSSCRTCTSLVWTL